MFNPSFAENDFVNQSVDDDRDEAMATELPLHRSVWEDSPSTLQDLLKAGQGKCQDGVAGEHQGLEIMVLSLPVVASRPLHSAQ